MNITFLVGNGFDISVGLDTSYKSFYNWYCSQPSPKKSIERLKKDIIFNKENWADFEIGLGKYTNNFSPYNIDEFFECYEDAVENIAFYLEQEISKFDFSNITNNDIECLRDGILNFYQELNPRECQKFDQIFKKDRSNDTIIEFISYNYTDVLDRCIEKIAATPLDRWRYAGSEQHIKINPQVLHVHGTSNKYPILGVSDEKQVREVLLSEPYFASTIIKSQSVDSIGQPWYALANETIKRSRIICIWGMSLGSSDSMWWNTIMEWLYENKERHLILFWYTETPPSRRCVPQYNRQTDMIKNLMISYLSTTSIVDNGFRDRIHVVFNTDKVLRCSLTPTPAKELVLT